MENGCSHGAELDETGTRSDICKKEAEKELEAFEQNHKSQMEFYNFLNELWFQKKAKLTEKSVQMQRLQQELSEKAHIVDSNSVEVAELTAKLDNTENDLTFSRQKEKESRMMLHNFQELAAENRRWRHCVDKLRCQEKEKLQEKSAEIQILQQKLIDKANLFDVQSVEVTQLMAKLEIAENEWRKKSEMGIQCVEEKLQAVEQKHKCETEFLAKTVEGLAAENRRLHDLVDKAERKEKVVVANSSELAEKMQRTELALGEKEHILDLQFKKAAELAANLETAEKELSLLRQAEKESQAMLCDFKLCKEKLSATEEKTQELESQLKSATVQLGKDKEAFDSIRKDMESLAGVRDNYKKATENGNSKILRLEEQLQVAEQKYKSDTESLKNKNEKVETENGQLRNSLGVNEVKLQEKSFEKQKLKKQLGDKARVFDLLYVELQNRSENLVVQMKKVEADKEALENMQKEIESIATQRDNYKKKVGVGNSKIQRLEEKLQVAEQVHKCEIESLNNEKNQVVAEFQRLQISEKASFEYLRALAASLNRLNTECSRYTDVEPLLKLALEIFEKWQQHSNVVITLNLLGFVCWKQAKVDEAKEYYTRALEIFEKKLAIDDSEMARTNNGLGVMYMLCGKYEDAETLFKRALEIWEKRQQHTNIAVDLRNLAFVCQKQGKNEEAVKYEKRALEISKK